MMVFGWGVSAAKVGTPRKATQVMRCRSRFIVSSRAWMAISIIPFRRDLICVIYVHRAICLIRSSDLFLIVPILQVNFATMKITRIFAHRVELPLREGSYKWSGGKSVTLFDST